MKTGGFVYLYNCGGMRVHEKGGERYKLDIKEGLIVPLLDVLACEE
jgi:hypothetical protein